MSRVSPVLLVVLYLFGTALILAEEQRPAGALDAAPASTLTLAGARQQALSTSPDLQALNARVQAAEGAARQARAFANPELALETEDFGGDKTLGVTPQNTVSLSQGIEWFGKRSARVEAAQHGSEVAVRDLARGRRDLLADVDRAFTALLGAQDRAAIAEQNAETAREVTRAVSSLVAAGEVSPVEEARAQGDEALAAIDLENSRRDLDLARRELTRLWGEDSPPSFAAAGTLAASAVLPDRDTAMVGLASLPDLTRWDAEVARQTSLVEFARKQVLPDLKLSVGTRSYSGLSGRAYAAGLAIPIPLATQYAGAKAEASAHQEQIKLDRRAEEVRIRVRFLAAHETLSRAISEARALRDEVLPRAARVYEALNEGYRRGKFRLLDLLEARRTLAQTRLRYVDALVRLNTADADLRRLLPDDTDNSIGVQR
ncbi:MAG: TolC family protein [Thermoanaerobaculaceae bacterium]|nr:TolC family protein [Thermoanaerobaculaceae bacterium]TAM45120.1 MAG: TolC family protein [Acidobacteriota bacterium]